MYARTIDYNPKCDIINLVNISAGGSAEATRIMLQVTYVNRIKEILKKLDMTQEELALRSGVPQPEISRIANDKKPKIELGTGIKLARGLGRPVEYVFPDY